MIDERFMTEKEARKTVEALEDLVGEVIARNYIFKLEWRTIWDDMMTADDIDRLDKIDKKEGHWLIKIYRKNFLQELDYVGLTSGDSLDEAVYMAKDYLEGMNGVDGIRLMVDSDWNDNTPQGHVDRSGYSFSDKVVSFKDAYEEVQKLPAIKNKLKGLVDDDVWDKACKEVDDWYALSTRERFAKIAKEKEEKEKKLKIMNNLFYKKDGEFIPWNNED